MRCIKSKIHSDFIRCHIGGDEACPRPGEHVGIMVKSFARPANEIGIELNIIQNNEIISATFTLRGIRSQHRRNFAMNNELERLWKQPTFENLNRGVRLDREDNFAWVHGAFTYLLIPTSDALPTKASVDTVKLETARKVVWLYHREAEAKWQRHGFITQWSSDCLEGIAREMADKLPRHPTVVDAVTRELEKRRDNVFADRSLTRGDELFFVKRMVTANVPDLFREALERDCIEEIKENYVETIDRWMDYLSELRSTNGHRPFIPLFRVLTSIKRVHAVITTQ
jgi:hypothetical protein